MLIQEENDIFYDDKKFIRCPYCNYAIFYLNEEYEHDCPINEQKFHFNHNYFKNKDNIFIPDINVIQNKCVKHNKEFLYYKDSNYYCGECLRDKKLNYFLILDELTLSKDEIFNYENTIKAIENTLLKIKETSERFIKDLKESYESFINRNKLLLDFCKSLINNNKNYEKNYNLISTIKRISIDINHGQIQKKFNYDLIDFYNNNNIITFNTDLKYEINTKKYSYFTSENILQYGKYYLGKKIKQDDLYERRFTEVYEGLSVKDKNLVTIKKLLLNDNKNYINEINILKKMSECENSIKYIDSFQEKNNIYIVTELYDKI